MNFIKELEESRLTRNENNVRVLTYTDCCERLYLSVLVLEVLRQYPTMMPAVKSYARRSKDPARYTKFRISGTDLYNFAYYVNGSDEALNKLKDPGAAKKTAATTKFNAQSLEQYIEVLKNGAASRGIAEFLIRLESSLNIKNSDYKNIRRGIANYTKLSKSEQSKLVTRLLFAVRAKLRSSDLIDDLEKLSQANNLETNKIVDPEQVPSTPDITLDTNTLALYRLLVGTKNLGACKLFLQTAIAGRSIPSTMVKGYMPIITMINDIVSAGPRGVAQLKMLHNRMK